MFILFYEIFNKISVDFECYRGLKSTIELTSASGQSVWKGLSASTCILLNGNCILLHGNCLLLIDNYILIFLKLAFEICNNTTVFVLLAFAV